MRKGEAKRILDRIDVIQAYVDGKKIQFRHDTSSTWSTFKAENPGLSCDDCEWRVAPEPREFWIRRETYYAYPEKQEDIIGELIHVREVLDD